MNELGRAQLLLRQGKYAESASRCERILRLKPLYADALELLGLARLGLGRASEGITCLWSAAALTPGKPGLLANLAEALMRSGRPGEAAEAYRRAIRHCGPSAHLFYNLGLSLQAAHDVSGAIESYRQCLELDPRIPEAHNNLGTLLDESGRFPEAIDCFNDALRLRPNYVRALTNLGKVLRQTGRAAEAVGILEKALILAPEHAPSLVNLGAALVDASRSDSAVQHLRRAIALEPRLPEAHYHLGRALLANGEVDGARVSLKLAVALKPGLVDAHLLLGQSLLSEGRLGEAVACLAQGVDANAYSRDLHILLGIARYRAELPEQAADSFSKAVAVDSRYAKAHLLQGWALEALERLPEAISSYERSAALDPEDPETMSSLLSCHMRICDWPRAEALHRRLRDAPQRIDGINPFVLLGVCDDPSQQLRASSARARSIAEGRTAIGASRCPDHERIRVAYLSRDFFNHATSYLTAELFGQHDRSAFEVFAVSYGPDDHSPIRERIAGSCDHFLDVRARSDREIATMLLERGIDILVDLKGYTAWARTEILAYRPAPIQVSYLGYPGTMGAPFIDYLLADEFLIPGHERSFYSENIVYLPNSYQVNDRRRAVPETALGRADFGLPPDAFVFCCFNNNWKITRPVFDVWMRLLAAVPGSVLWLLESNPWSVENLRSAARSSGIAAERLIFCRRTDNARHLARHRLADLFLDTLPVNAHTTASDALWTGLPLVTCAGRGFAARVAGSLMRAAGIGDLVTASLEEYAEAALSLARDPQRLAAIRANLMRDREALALFDTAEFCRHLESAFRWMWRLNRDGSPPQDLKVADSSC